jgi:hypothetical protein
MRIVSYVICMGKKRNTCKCLFGKPEENRALGIPRGRREDNTEMDLTEIGWKGGRVWTELIWLRTEINGGLLQK